MAASASMEVEQVDGGGVPELKYPLSTCQMIIFGQPRAAQMAGDYTQRPARFSTYIEGYGMSTGRVAALISLCKSFDLFVGFAVGKASDNCRSRFGRRRPWVGICGPIGFVCLILFCTPSLVFDRGQDQGKEVPCSGEVTKDFPLNSTDCSALSACLVDHFKISEAHPSGTIPLQIQGETGEGDTFALTMYFIVFYVGTYGFLWSLAGIPMEAFGMELSDDSEVRNKLYAIRGLWTFVGLILPAIMTIVLTTEFNMEDDIPGQYEISATIFGIWGILALLLLVFCLKERPLPTAKEGEESEIPMVPAIKRLFSNTVYLKYLFMKFPMTFMALMPANMFPFFAKFNLFEESYVLLQNQLSLLSVGLAVIFIPVVVAASRRIGRQILLQLIFFWMGFVEIALFMCPDETLRAYPVLIVLFYVSLSAVMAVGYTLPDAMCADVIDYDELITGSRNEAMFTVAEINIIQSLEIVAGVLPLLALQILGYVNNSGCHCGCGTSCVGLGYGFTRWICPGDVGFACSSQVEAALLFGDQDRTAPCVIQSASVQWGIKFFFSLFPGICAVMSGFMAGQQPITAKVHHDIRTELDKRDKDPSYKCLDPITGKTIRLPINSRDHLFREHFTAGELRKAVTDPQPVEKVKGMVRRSMVVGFVLLVLNIFFMVFFQTETTNTFGSLFLAFIFIFIAWDGLRMRAINNPPELAANELHRQATTLLETQKSGPLMTHR